MNCAILIISVAQFFMKISFCITCKNRLFHLSQTLPSNLINCQNYNVEFVLLNYNSTDGLHEWAKDKLKFWEDRGVLKYLITKKPKYFNPAHAKNIAHKNSSGDILCNLDCDNYVFSGFCDKIFYLFEKDKNIIYGGRGVDGWNNSGSCGRIAVHKKHFYSVNGYDENEVNETGGWGFDDVNFRLRTLLHNNLKVTLSNSWDILCLNHSNFYRCLNHKEKNILKSRQISINYISNIISKKQYVANQGTKWGEIDDLSFGLKT